MCHTPLILIAMNIVGCMQLHIIIHGKHSTVYSYMYVYNVMIQLLADCYRCCVMTL